MNDLKRNVILDAATKVFARKGYQYATISEISREAGMSTGLVYAYFENKLDVLLSIVLHFWQTINQSNQKKLSTMRDPFDKLFVVFHNLEESLVKEEKALYIIKVLNEALPHIVMIKKKNLQEKRQSIILENKKLFETIDTIIAEGQKLDLFDKSLKPSVLRQILCGGIEILIYGLFFKTHCKIEIGYDEADLHKGAVKLIEKLAGK